MPKPVQPLLPSILRLTDQRESSRAPGQLLVVGVADMAVSDNASAELVTYSLGSCVGVTIYDRVSRAGGLLHILLPDSLINPARAAINPFMFVDTGLPRLFHAVYALGGEKWRLKVILVGGAQFIEGGELFNIGQNNVAAVEKLLARNGVSVYAKDVGGANSRTVRLKLTDGTVTVQTPGATPYVL